MNWWLKYHEKLDWENLKLSDVNSKIFIMKTDNSKFLWSEIDMNQYSFLKSFKRKFLNMKNFWIRNTNILILKSCSFVYDRKKSEKKSVLTYYENILCWLWKEWRKNEWFRRTKRFVFIKKDIHSQCVAYIVDYHSKRQQDWWDTQTQKSRFIIIIWTIHDYWINTIRFVYKIFNCEKICKNKKVKTLWFLRLRPYVWKSIQNWYFLHLKKSLKKSVKKFDKKKYFIIIESVKFESVDEKVFDCKKLWTFFKRHIVSSRFYNSEVAYVNRYDSRQTWLSFKYNTLF